MSGHEKSPKLRQVLHLIGGLWFVLWPVIIGFTLANEAWDLAAILGGYWVASVSIWIVTRP